MKHARKFMIVVPILLILMLAVSAYANAGVGQDPYYVSGTVKDADGVAVSGATITIERVETGETNLKNADGTAKTSATDPPRVDVTTNANGTYLFELLNMASFDDGDEFKITATKGSDTGSITITIDTDTPPGYDDADITVGEVVAEEEVTHIDSTLVCWAGLIIGVIFLFIMLVYSRRHATK